MKYLAGFAIAVVIFAVCILILFNEELIFWQTFAYMAGKFAGEGGIHPRLAEVLAVAYALVFAFAVTISLNPARRRRGLIAIAAITALYSGFIYAMTRDANYQNDGKAIAFLEEQADGTFVKTHRRRNAGTGALNIRITPDNERWADGRAAQRIEPGASTVFFGLSGRPLVFYARRGRMIEFFDRPGAHPQTRQRLDPVSPEVVHEALALLPAASGGAGTIVEVRPPRRVTILPDMELFDTNGSPLYWFDPDYEKWELYDAAGAHPRSGATMRPLDAVYASVLRQAIRDEQKRQPEDLQGAGLQELRNYARDLGTRTRKGV